MGWIRSFISAPVEIHGHIAGLINIIGAEPDFFTPLHAERLMAFASQAAIAIENARLFEQTRQLSITDSLTELYNRRHFFEIAALEFERTHRYNRALSVVMIDIDHFKSINDTHGHTVGDLALCEIVTRIKSSVRTVDIVARYGGEEFVVLMPETGLEEARQVAERIRQIVANRPIEHKDAIIFATLSLGVAEMDKNTKDLDELIKYADRALYKAKTRGRNCVESYISGE
jgi:diguanylate cyclase (GGDEF)-like protein